jgi:hypothetical protein
MQGAPPSPLVNFIPLLLLGATFGIFSAFLAGRKGKSRLLWFFLGCVPLASFLPVIWLASLPDIGLLRRIEALEASGIKPEA